MLCNYASILAGAICPSVQEHQNASNTVGYELGVEN